MKVSEVKQLRGNKIIIVMDDKNIPKSYVNLKTACEALDISYSTISKKFQDRDYYEVNEKIKIYRLEIKV
jgi:uncharacterized protein (UPF0261 family)